MNEVLFLQIIEIQNLLCGLHFLGALIWREILLSLSQKLIEETRGSEEPTGLGGSRESNFIQSEEFRGLSLRP